MEKFTTLFYYNIIIFFAYETNLAKIKLKITKVPVTKIVLNINRTRQSKQGLAFLLIYQYGINFYMGWDTVILHVLCMQLFDENKTIAKNYFNEIKCML